MPDAVSPPASPRERLIVALDVPGGDSARRLVERLAGSAGMLKVGSQLFTAAGPAFVAELVRAGERVFLDLKYHDIPHTVARAVESATRLGVSLVDVHALGGKAMVRDAADALRATAASAGITTQRPRLLAITVLTSHDAASFAEVGVARSIAEAVPALASLARDAGADGVVASPHEVASVRAACGAGFLIVTPGIRPAGAALDDQARAATPRIALSAGADYLVVGRPITRSDDPAGAAARIVDEIAAALA